MYNQWRIHGGSKSLPRKEKKIRNSYNYLSIESTYYNIIHKIIVATGFKPKKLNINVSTFIARKNSLLMIWTPPPLTKIKIRYCVQLFISITRFVITHKYLDSNPRKYTALKGESRVPAGLIHETRGSGGCVSFRTLISMTSLPRLNYVSAPLRTVTSANK